MADPHPLDRPVWSSLRTGWAALAEGPGHALRLNPAYGPFGAAADADPVDLTALARLIPTGGELWLVEAAEPAIPPGATVIRRGALHQMVAQRIAPKPLGMDILELGDEDAVEMRELAWATKPGPFTTLTHRLGGFVGVRAEGRLIAMAGERMRTDGFSEVSGVCTDPGHRGRGLAGALMSMVAQRIVERGETPFLHSYAHNAAAIGLYESLGFRFRTGINLAILTLDQGSSRLASP
jgi:predicted GNAT family acetyltransferase